MEGDLALSPWEPWNHTVPVRLCLASATYKTVFKLHPCCSTSLFLRLNYTPLCG